MRHLTFNSLFLEKVAELDAAIKKVKCISLPIDCVQFVYSK